MAQYTLLRDFSRSISDAASSDDGDVVSPRPWAEGPTCRCGKSSIIRSLAVVFLNAIICLGYTLWIHSRLLHCHSFQTPSSHHALSFREKQFDVSFVHLSNGTLNPDKTGHFNGEPRPELAASWAHLMRHQNIAVPRESLAQAKNERSLIELSDGSGYAASMAVFHGLHCVKRFHHFVYRDHYYPDLSLEDEKRLVFHIEHCMDWLRQYVQCNADMTLMPFYWGSKQAIPLAIDKNKHQCVAWGELEEWNAKRSFDMFKPGLLVHPILGDAYNGSRKGDKIGITLDDHVLSNIRSARTGDSSFDSR